ncbi:MAG: type II toxin-antitoxin system prevent-host-death family antitoxin [Coriobacteriales bacterium]|jgi:prevent-host-death family protein|nr:type II toxin-antitoxin system prevent-host-death family antitoxin [Coriobacteriales bacterium]
MPVTMNMQEAKTNLSRLVNAALAGDEVVIANRGVPAVKLVPYVRPKKRELGFVKGDESWDDAFFEPLSEEDLELWGS